MYLFTFVILAFRPSSTYLQRMEAKYCSNCYHQRPISAFLNYSSAGPASKVLATCINCRNAGRKYDKKRKTSRQLGPENPPVPSESSISANNPRREPPIRGPIRGHLPPLIYQRRVPNLLDLLHLCQLPNPRLNLAFFRPRNGSLYRSLTLR